MWRPVDFPPWPTVYHYFRAWRRDGTLTRLHNGLRVQVRPAESRAAEPSAAILDSQSIRAAETIAKSSRGFGPVTGAGVQDPDYVTLCQTETCSRLSLVKGCRLQVLQRSRRVIPARRAIRSSSEGHT